MQRPTPRLCPPHHRVCPYLPLPVRVSFLPSFPLFVRMFFLPPSVVSPPASVRTPTCVCHRLRPSVRIPTYFISIPSGTAFTLSISLTLYDHESRISVLTTEEIQSNMTMTPGLIFLGCKFTLLTMIITEGKCPYVTQSDSHPSPQMDSAILNLI